MPLPTRQAFIDANIDWVQSLMDGQRIPRDIKGVHFAFVHRYSTPGHDLDGKLCLVAAQERGGQYFGKFNFFGGKVDPGDGRNPAARVLSASYRELWEEMGACIVVPLHRIVIDIIVVGESIIWVCAVAGISSSKITIAIARKDRNANLPGCYKEMEACQQITRTDLHKCSSYVKQHYNAIMAAYKAVYNAGCPDEPMHFVDAMRAVYCELHT